MSTPKKFRVATTLPATNTSKIIIFNLSLPDTNYTVNAEFDFSTGGWWVTSKAVDRFTINIASASGSQQNMVFDVYHDPSTFEA